MGIRTIRTGGRLRKENGNQVSGLGRLHCRLDITRTREETPIETWTVHSDGAWQNEGVGIAAILASPSGAKIRYAAHLNFDQSAPSTNNTTEYEALLLRLCKMKALGHQNCIVKTDSKVIADHIEKESEARKPELIQYLEVVRAMEKHFRGFTIIHIPRAQNDEADRLAKAAARK